MDDEAPGIHRRRCGRGFAYHDPEGRLIRDPDLRARIQALVIPPAWEDVWICPSPRGHLQATGRDEKGRKQYLYHERFRAAREAQKFERLAPFGYALPRLRRRAGIDLSRTGLPRAKVLAAGIRLLDRAAIRVGSEDYERENGSYGLTTLRRRHLDVGRRGALIQFEGKGGKTVEIELDDPDLADVLRECERLPGYRVFQYMDEDGGKRTVSADDINSYLREALDAPFTAKDFRTWGGTVRAVSVLADTDPEGAEEHRAATLREAVGAVARHLHNTPAVSRDSYIHPRIIELYEAGDFHSALERAGRRRDMLRTPGRRREECLVLGLLGADGER